jgi:hypothetical protein
MTRMSTHVHREQCVSSSGEAPRDATSVTLRDMQPLATAEPETRLTRYERGSVAFGD